MRYLSLSALLLAAPLTASAQGVSINVVNFDFETGGVADGSASNPGVVPTGWTAIPNNAPGGGFFGYFNPQDSGFTGTTDTNTTTRGVIGTMSGPNVFYFGSSVTGQGIQQTLLNTSFALNTTYALTLSVGCRNNPNVEAGITMQLYAGSTLLASNTVFNTTGGTFTDYTLSYTSSSLNTALVGTALTISFAESDPAGSTTRIEADMDNVRVTATPVVPEPSTWAAVLAGTGLLGVMAWRRRSVASAH